MLRILPAGAKLTIILFLALVVSSCSNQRLDENYEEPQLYKHAKSAMNRGEFDRAVERLEILEARYPFGDYAIQGQLDLMYGYYRANGNEDAIATAQRFRRLYPTSAYIDYTYYIEGVSEFERNRAMLANWFPKDLALFDQQILKNAYNAFFMLVKNYPHSIYAADAEQRMLYLRNMMAENCKNAASYNAKRGAYLAAINRAYFCIENFNGAPAVETLPQLISDNQQKLDQPQQEKVRWLDRSRW